MKKDMRIILGTELSRTKIQDSARNGGYHTIRIPDTSIKIAIVLVFAKTEHIDPVLVHVEGRGAVIHLPSFWLGKDLFDLAPAFIEKLIDDFYSEYGYENYDGNDNSSANCVCRGSSDDKSKPACQPKPIGPVPMPNPITVRHL